MRRKTIQFPKIGMRIIKSAIGVFLCYVINIFRNGEGLIFYSQLAVLWCMQDYVSETKAKAKQRSIGTSLGALVGLVYLLLDKFVGETNTIVTGAIVSVFIILLLYLTVLLKKKQASYFSCVVFLSIIVNHVGDSNPYLFVWNRFLDTMIGILLGVVVNSFSLPREKHTEILFVTGLDDTLLNSAGDLSDYSKVELNRMIEEGLNFTISTVRTPAYLIESLRDVNLKLPMIVMDGAVLFDLKKKKYELVYVISPDISAELIAFFKEQKVDCFSNVIMDDLLVIYYEETNNDVYNEIVDSLRGSLYRNYVKKPLPAGQEVVYFMLIDKKEKMQRLYDALVKSQIAKNLKIIFNDSEDYPGYASIRIYNHNAQKENMLHYLSSKLACEKVITYGTIPGRYTHLIDSKDANKLVRQIKKEFEPFRRL